jgi:hypothetical protein
MPMTEITIDVPIRTVSEANNREHWRVKNKRKLTQQAAVAAYWIHTVAVPAKSIPQRPYLVTLSRIGKRMLDDDNLASSFKGVRDQVAKMLKVDDGNRAAVLWKYRQEIGKSYAVRIHIKSRRRLADASSPAPDATTTGAR